MEQWKSGLTFQAPLRPWPRAGLTLHGTSYASLARLEDYPDPFMGPLLSLDVS